LLNIALTDFIQNKTEPTRHRRALVIVNSATPVLPSQLAVSGYEAYTATMETARQAIQEFSPDLAIMEIHQEGEKEAVALARRLRAEPSTYALPLVFVWTRDDRTTRNAALNIGVDDYFALSLPFSDILVRLDALFWRIEAGRRTVAVAGNQRLEIDNFMLMLDNVREDIEAGRQGAIAVINAAQAEEAQPPSKQDRDRVLSEAHGFLKLYLRRIDTVAFYGPTTLLVYLPRLDARAAREAIAKLHENFSGEHRQSAISVGLAAFPEDSTDVESLIERAENEASQGAQAATSSPTAPQPNLREAPAPLRVVEEPKPQTPVVAPPVVQAPAPPPPAAETKPVEAKPAARPREAAPAKPVPQTVPERRPAQVERKPAASEARMGAAASAAPPEKARVEKFVSHVVREKRLDDALDPVVAPPPVRKNSVQTNGAEAVRASEAAARERERRARGTIMPRRLLLTVSDAARMAQLNSLIRSAGYEARAAFGGQQALDLLRIERPDLLLLDFELQGIDGLETLRRLRKQNGGRLSLPVVLLLPEKFETVRQEAMALGTRGIVSMPYDPVDLLDTVRAAGTMD
jgi:PleD family two-component response regulator